MLGGTPHKHCLGLLLCWKGVWSLANPMWGLGKGKVDLVKAAVEKGHSMRKGSWARGTQGREETWHGFWVE